MLRQIVNQLEKTEAPDSILVLTPSRLAASILRDQIALDSKLAASSPRARSVSSFSFATLGADSNIRLLSGAAQERLLRSLVDEAHARKAGARWSIDSQTLRLQGFVQELRDLFTIIIENSLSIADLENLQSQYPSLRLQVAIDLLPIYRERVGLEGMLDPAQLSIAAMDAYVPGTYKYVLVDDAQNLTRGQLRLVEKLSQSATCFLFGDPDTATLGFRGSAPASFIELARASGFKELTLPPRELSPGLNQLLYRACSRIPVSLVSEHRPRPSGSDVVSGFQFSSIVEETDWLAQQIRLAHISGTSFDEIAVVARTRTQLEQLARELGARKVPVRIIGVQRALRELPMARAILDFVEVALGSPSLEQIEQLLLSPLVGLDSIELREIRRLIIPYRMEGLEQTQALLELLGEKKPPKLITGLAQRLAELRELEEHGAYQAVSIAWSLLSDADRARLSDQDVDAALEVFAAAMRFDDRAEGRALDFTEQQLRSRVPEDSLAPISRRPAVILSTASNLVGSYKVVAIPRLQEGIWPNLTPRNALLGAASLQAFVLGRISSPEIAARSELADELRMFYRAIAAAEERLILSAMSDETEQPSQFFQLARIELEQTEVLDFDLRRLVGRLRRRLFEGDVSAAPILAALALQAVPGSHPKSWQGLMPVSDSQPLGRIGNRAAASRLEAFEKCPLHWFISTFATDTTSLKASLGILLHSALENADQQSPSTFVERNWQELEFDSHLTERQVRKDALQMAKLLEDYLKRGTELVAAEQGFELQIGELQILGKIDRVEKTPDGDIAVDLKTGKSPESKEKAQKNRQLAVYQLAIEQQSKTAGGRLVYVGGGKIQEREQAPMSDELRGEIVELANAMTQQLGEGVVSANIDEHCSGDGNCQLLLSKVVSGG
jgi:superfamily I DNA/RNA helicase/CRISPR/Cas system-associated exonuclease Cas4 (RecB family)